MTDTDALIAAVKARRQAAGLHVKVTNTRDGHTSNVYCSTEAELADLKRRCAKAGHYTVATA